MSKYLSAVLIGFVLCLLTGGNLSRRATADTAADSKSAPTRVAVVDMSKVYSSSKFLQKERDGLKERVAEMQETVQKMNRDVQEQVKKWRGLEPGSEERKELEAKIKKAQTDVQEYHRTTNVKLMKDQADVFLQTYRKAMPEIANFSQAHGIDLVLQNQPDPVDEGDPMKLLSSLNRAVLYENKLDITEDVISALADQ